MDHQRVWRWHFFAGLVCLPFLLLLAVTGGLYLFKEPIESVLYAKLQRVDVRTAPALDAQALVARALASEPAAVDEVVRFVTPAGPGRSAEVGLRSGDGIVAVYLDPADGRVLGRLRDDERLMETVKRLHSLAIAGPLANRWIEVVAGWAIVLVVTGVFLWSRPLRRSGWRRVHALTGVFAAAVILFLAVTGMPWSAFWGEQFGQLAARWDLGTPAYVWGATPQSQAPLEDLRAVPWTASHAPLPSSRAAASSIGLNDALEVLARIGVPAGTPVRLPAGPQGVYSAMHVADDVHQVRVVHLDRYSGAVLADIRFEDYGALGKATEWGVSVHTGRQFGGANQLVMLAGCLAIVALAVSGTVMWWKRRPRGQLAAPARRPGDRASTGAVAVAVLLGLLYPMLGASMIVAAAFDAAAHRLPRRRQPRSAP